MTRFDAKFQSIPHKIFGIEGSTASVMEGTCTYRVARELWKYSFQLCGLGMDPSRNL